MRDRRLETFLAALAAAVAARAPAGSAVAGLQREIFARAGQAATDDAPVEGRGGETDPHGMRAFVANHLDSALSRLGGQDEDLRAVGEAFRALGDDLNWARRPAGRDDPPGFRDTHANATLLGVDGVEVRGDIRIGASVLAPGTTYPAHRHPPEELYLVLSDGDWRNTETGWWTPGVGGLVHNPPGIEHAMRAGDGPLFAIWCLLIEDGARAAA